MVSAFLLVFGVAAAVTFVTTPAVRLLCLRLGALAQPGERHVHTRATPVLGGLALFAGVLSALAVASQLEAFRPVFGHTSEPEAVVLASLVIVVLGLVDDIRGISAPAKLAGQILAAGLLAVFGFRLLFVYLPGTIVSLDPDVGAIVTVLAVVAMINAVNLVDGLDGLAAGIVAIAAVALFTYTQMADPWVLFDLASSAPLLLAVIAGVCVGFLVHNFNPASIFMGDSGAMLLGLLLAAAGVSAIGATVRPSRGAFAAVSIPVLVPFLVLAVPFVDTIWTILRRLLSGRAVFSPDKQHLHHRLLEIGHSHRRAVLTMYYWSALIAFGAVGAVLLPRQVVVLVLLAGVAVGFGVALTPRLTNRRRGGRPHVLFFTRSRLEDRKKRADQRKRVGRQL